MLLLVSVAIAGSSASSFATDGGDWVGGSVAGGVLVLQDTAGDLDLGQVLTFELTARARLATGDRFEVQLSDDCALSVDYTGARSIGFGTGAVPFAAAELEMLPDSGALLSPMADELGGIRHPDVVEFGGHWWMFYGAADAAGAHSVHAATSSDLATWTRVEGLSLPGASEPTAVVEATSLVLYYTDGGSIWRTESDDGLSFDFPTVALAPGPGFDAAGLGHPSMLFDGDGLWRLWYGVPTTGASGSASSADGLTFTRDAELWPDATRLSGLDVTDGTLGFEAVYTMLDSVGFASSPDDSTFADDSTDVRPALVMNQAAWSDGGFGTAALVRNGVDLSVFVDAMDDGVSVIGRVATRPEPGTWGALTMTWDGSEVLASWNGGPTQSCALGAFEGISIVGVGRAEIDEVRVDYSADAGVDTADTGGTDTGDSADSADTADTGDTAADSADTGGPAYNAGEWLGEPGGCGCESGAGGGGVAGLMLAGALAQRRRRRAP